MSCGLAAMVVRAYGDHRQRGSTVSPGLTGESRRTWLREIHLSTTGSAGVEDDVGRASRSGGPSVRVAIVFMGPAHPASADHDMRRVERRTGSPAVHHD
jgi:hypothetical protein